MTGSANPRPSDRIRELDGLRGIACALVLLWHLVNRQIGPQGGAWGFGPGSFASIFPYATFAEGDSLRGFWRFAHEDYLQTAVEWGYAGAFLWGMFFFGGLLSAFFLALRPRRTMRLSTRILLGGVGSSLLGCALHSLVDFPLQIASLGFYVFIFLAIGWGAWQWPREGKARR